MSLATASIATASITSQGYELFEYAGHYYGLTQAGGTWTEAEAEAIGLGGNLVAINSAGEQSFLESMFVPTDRGISEPFWIGLHDPSTNGNYTWSNGDSVTFLNWKPGEPNKSFGLEHYVAMNWEYGRGGPIGTWNDAPLSGTQEIGITDPGTIGPYRGIIELTALATGGALPEPHSLLAWAGLAGCVVCRRRRQA